MPWIRTDRDGGEETEVDDERMLFVLDGDGALVEELKHSGDTIRMSFAFYQFRKAEQHRT